MQKVETRVVLRHVPTGIRVVAQEERTREANRLRARERLVEVPKDPTYADYAKSVVAKENAAREKEGTGCWC